MLVSYMMPKPRELGCFETVHYSNLVQQSVHQLKAFAVLDVRKVRKRARKRLSLGASPPANTTISKPPHAQVAIVQLSMESV